MQFRVVRTSITSSEQPCDEAKLRNYTDQFSKEREKGWFIHLRSLKELLAFQQRYSRLIISNDLCTGGPQVEIYDDFRE